MDLQNISSRPNKSARLGNARKDGCFSKRIITPECPKHSGLGIHSFIICPDSHHRFLFPSPPESPNIRKKLQAVKFGIGSFTSLFGSKEGRELQAIAKKYHWPLLLGGCVVFGQTCHGTSGIFCRNHVNMLVWGRGRKGKLSF